MGITTSLYLILSQNLSRVQGSREDVRDYKPEKDTHRLRLRRWRSHMTRNVGGLWERAAPQSLARKGEPHAYGHQELGSANNLNALRCGFFPKLPGKGRAWLTPALQQAEVLSRKVAEPTWTPHPVFLLLQNCKLIDGVLSH